MPRYCIRDGETLSHAGTVLVAGAFVELPREVADDPAVRGSIVEVDADGKAVEPRPVDELDRFKLHEQVSILRDRRAAKAAELEAIDQQLAQKDAELAAAVAAQAAPKAAAPASPPAAATTKATKTAAPAAPSKE
jgi:hypothetical protein